MELTKAHPDLLRVVDALEEPTHAPGTKPVGERLLEPWKERGSPYAWQASPPLHGTHLYADELRIEGFLDVHVGMVRFHRGDEPAETAEQYWLSLTDAGRQALAEAGPA